MHAWDWDDRKIENKHIHVYNFLKAHIICIVYCGK
jgi:hypothetical protein